MHVQRLIAIHWATRQTRPGIHGAPKPATCGDASAVRGGLRAGGGAQRLGRGAQLLLPLERVAARLAREAVLGVGLDHLHLLLLLLHDGPRGVGAVGRRVAAVGITHAAVEVALERVEVLVVARLLWVPRLEDGLLGINAPDVAKL